MRKRTQSEIRPQSRIARPSRGAPLAGLLVVGLGWGVACDSTPAHRPPPPERTVAERTDVAPEDVAAPEYRVAKGGRISLTRAQLGSDPVFALALDVSDESRGEGPRETKIVSVDSRLLETVAWPIPGEGAGLRLEIDRDWLTPSSYMIQVATAEHRPLALHRYFLEVTP